jgi:glycosyltransferase involved in cell wall biosynthesis
VQFRADTLIPLPACTDVAVIIPARNEEARIAATVAAASSVSDLVVVVDDASCDKTAQLAREAGAVVVKRSRSNGKAAAMMTGAGAVAAREAGRSSPRARHLLFLDADLEHTASEAWKLVTPVREGSADMTIAVLPTQRTAGGGHGLVVRLAAAGIAHLTGFRPAQPLSGMRCISRQAFDAVQPLARGWGVETALTVDVLGRGYKIAEVPAGFHHRVTGRGFGAQVHRAKQFRDVAVALGALYLRGRVRRSGQRLPG